MAFHITDEASMFADDGERTPLRSLHRIRAHAVTTVPTQDYPEHPTGYHAETEHPGESNPALPPRITDTRTRSEWPYVSRCGSDVRRPGRRAGQG